MKRRRIKGFNKRASPSVKQTMFLNQYEQASYFGKLKRTCQKTGMFDTEEEAIVASDDYNRRILFANMNAYHCPRHQRWHIGHWDKNGQAWTTNPPVIKTE